MLQLLAWPLSSSDSAVESSSVFSLLSSHERNGIESVSETEHIHIHAVVLKLQEMGLNLDPGLS